MTQTSLTQQEQDFIDFLFDGEQMRHPNEAKVMAGYPQDYPVLKIVRKVNEALVQKYDDYLALYAPKGLAGLMEVLNSPEVPGSALKLKAVIELLDRAGVTRKEKSEQVQAQQSYIFMLPNKASIDETISHIKKD